MWLFIGVFALAAAGLIACGLYQDHRAKLISGRRSVKLKDLRPGFAVVHGKSRTVAPLISPYRKKPCLYYKYILQEFTNPPGQTHASVMIDPTLATWVTTREEERIADFTLEDGTGVAMVHAQSADLVFHHTDEPPVFEITSVSVGLGPVGASAHPRVGSQREFETTFGSERWLSVVGVCEAVGESSPDFGHGARLAFSGAMNAPAFLVSDRPPAQLAETYSRSALGAFLGAGVAALAAVLLAYVHVHGA